MAVCNRTRGSSLLVGQGTGIGELVKGCHGSHLVSEKRLSLVRDFSCLESMLCVSYML